MNYSEEFGDALARIRGFSQSLSPSEKKIADYVEKHPKEVVRMTLSEISMLTGVSDATVVRFFRVLGYDKWLDFILDLSNSIPASSDLIHDEITSSDTPGTIAEKVMESAIETIRANKEILNHEALRKAVEFIEKARNVFIVGVGTSGPMAHEFYNRLFRLRIPCQVETDSYLQIMHSVLLTEEDVLFVISQSGTSVDPIRTASEAQKVGCKVICLTGSTTSELAQYADIILISVSHGPLAESLTSRIAQYSIIHAIYNILALRNMEATIENERRIWDALTSWSRFLNLRRNNKDY